MATVKKAYGIQVTLDPAHIGPVLSAMDLYFRILMGQTNVITEHFWHKDDADMDKARLGLDLLRAALFPQFAGSPGASLGISHAPESARIVYEVYALIRRADAFARMPEGPRVHGSTVIFDEPLKTSNEPYPRVRTLGLLELLADAAQDDPEPGKKKPKKGKKGGKLS